MLLKSVHFFAIVLLAYASYYHICHVNPPEPKQPSFGGKLKYLTVINALLQTGFFIVCLLNDIFGTNAILPKKTPLIRKIKDFYHSSLGFPLAAFVSISFWGLYAIDRELVFPKVLDGYFPTWLNHLVHTSILVFTITELFVNFRVYPSRRTGLTCLVVFMLIYLCWTFIIYAKSGRWVYPVMEVLNWPLRIVFILVLLAFSVLTYIIGEKLNQLIWTMRNKSFGSLISLPLIFHGCALANSLFADYYFANHVNLPNENLFKVFHELGGRYNFLTVWNLIIQGIFFSICIGNDLIGTNDPDPVVIPLIRKMTDFLFGAVVLPLGLFIGFMFWSIWFIDRDLIFPSTLDPYMPNWFNHQMHSIIIVNIIVQLFFCHNKHPKSSGLMVVHCLIICYVSWIFYVQFVVGVWVYPVLIILSWPMKILFLIGAITGVYSAYFLGEYLHNLVWEGKLEEIKRLRMEEFSKKQKNAAEQGLKRS